jgi:HD-GYP domain-containing protein (c-di-GMP phosphodiesterase class II)
MLDLLSPRPRGTLVRGVLAGAGILAAWAADARRRDREKRLMHRTLIDLLLNALTADDPLTARHSRRVANLTDALADARRMRRRERATLRVASLLHDMGKIDDRFWDIIHSRTPLTAEQRAEIKNHPHESAHILGPLERIHPGITCIVSSHHECWNGSGYPQGLRGEEIPLAARMIAVADSFDAMVQPRTYKNPMPLEDALGKLRDGSGSQFAPEVVRLLEDPAVWRRWEEIARAGQEDERRAQQDPQAAKEEEQVAV